MNRQMSQEHFEYILENWNIADGVQGLEYGEGKIWWFHSKFGPRPECVPANFVNINFNRFTFRISVAEMERVVENYYHQKITECIGMRASREGEISHLEKN